MPTRLKTLQKNKNAQFDQHWETETIWRTALWHAQGPQVGRMPSASLQSLFVTLNWHVWSLCHWACEKRNGEGESSECGGEWNLHSYLVLTSLGKVACEAAVPFWLTHSTLLVLLWTKRATENKQGTRHGGWWGEGETEHIHHINYLYELILEKDYAFVKPQGCIPQYNRKHQG